MVIIRHKMEKVASFYQTGAAPSPYKVPAFRFVVGGMSVTDFDFSQVNIKAYKQSETFRRIEIWGRGPPFMYCMTICVVQKEPELMVQMDLSLHALPHRLDNALYTIIHSIPHQEARSPNLRSDIKLLHGYYQTFFSPCDRPTGLTNGMECIKTWRLSDKMYFPKMIRVFTVKSESFHGDMYIFDPYLYNYGDLFTQRNPVHYDAPAYGHQHQMLLDQQKQCRRYRDKCLRFRLDKSCGNKKCYNGDLKQMQATSTMIRRIMQWGPQAMDPLVVKRRRLRYKLKFHNRRRQKRLANIKTKISRRRGTVSASSDSTSVTDSGSVTINSDDTVVPRTARPSPSPSPSSSSSSSSASSCSEQSDGELYEVIQNENGVVTSDRPGVVRNLSLAYSYRNPLIVTLPIFEQDKKAVSLIHDFIYTQRFNYQVGTEPETLARAMVISDYLGMDQLTIAASNLLAMQTVLTQFGTSFDRLLHIINLLWSSRQRDLICKQEVMQEMKPDPDRPFHTNNMLSRCQLTGPMLLLPVLSFYLHEQTAEQEDVFRDESEMGKNCTNMAEIPEPKKMIQYLIQLMKECEKKKVIVNTDCMNPRDEEIYNDDDNYLNIRDGAISPIR